jgi:hypothetical protein
MCRLLKPKGHKSIAGALLRRPTVPDVMLLAPRAKARCPRRRHSAHCYPVDDLAEAFAEGIKVAHPMPEFRMEPDQIEDLIAYLKSLER